ncbi:hypothetical protein [Flavobacterium sp. 3HN19-14]|uniref:hypothetical protein n=1 Tax=Flavobacterium sp. 3HN19-14 TaxID=3448133 RepID=UPI003EE00C04
MSHSTVPFLVVENENCKKTLGSRDIASVLKKKTFDVEVHEGDDVYFGQLQILSYLTGYRKCNLKYATEVLKIFNKKLGDLMPVISIIPGETSPKPF